MPDIYGNGIKQGDLVDLLVLIKTNWNAILTKLDNDSGVADEDYTSLHAISIPDGINTGHPKAIRSQGLVATYLNSFITQFNLVLTKLDTESLTDSDYNSTLAITDVIDGAANDGINQIGTFQGCVVNMLQSIITKVAALNAKLDLDGTVNGTDFASLWNITDNVDDAGTKSRVHS